jgi:hypothetical protein
MATENITLSAPRAALNQIETFAKKIDNTPKKVVEPAGHNTAKPTVIPLSQPFGPAMRSVEASCEAAKPMMEPSSQPLDKAKEKTARIAHDVAQDAGETLDRVNHTVHGTLEAGRKATQQILQSSQEFDKVMERTHRASYALAQHAGETLTQVAQVTHIVATGYPSITSKLVEYTQQSAQRNVDTLNQLLQARTVNDALQLQTQYARDSLEAFLKTSAQIAQVATDTANEARQTLGRRST